MLYMIFNIFSIFKKTKNFLLYLHIWLEEKQPSKESKFSLMKGSKSWNGVLILA